MLRRILCIWLVLLSLISHPLLLPVPQCEAQEKTLTPEQQTAFDALLQQATELYGKKQFAEAAAAFIKAYEIKPVSNILYNVAVIYEEQGDRTNASAYFLKYADAPDASPKTKKDALERRGNLLFSSKDYPGALDSFEKAYAVEATATGRYNIARSREKMGQFKESLDIYEKLLEDPDLPLEVRKDVVERVKTLRETLALKTQPTDKDTKPPPKKVIEVIPPDYTGPIIVLSTGGALILGGAVFGGLASSKNTAMEDATTVKERQDAADTGQTFAAVSDGLWISGSVLAAGGLVWLLLLKPTEREVLVESTTNLMLLPQISPNHLGLGLNLTF